MVRVHILFKKSERGYTVRKVRDRYVYLGAKFSTKEGKVTLALSFASVQSIKNNKIFFFVQDTGDSMSICVRNLIRVINI